MSDGTKLILEAIQNLGKRFDDLESRFDNLEKRFDNLEGRFDNLEKRFDNLESRITTLESEVKDIQLTLENETNRNIRVIAEGHTDLIRKLDGALKVESEKEMLLLRVNILENEVRRLKEKVG